ncbi:MAG TPA: phage holin family protein [Streptosporangiaceae bacterium]|jgi:uncharacterized membrane protein YqjE|nr:phage holin family protein [Streptosporangiaceae bacterium]
MAEPGAARSAEVDDRSVGDLVSAAIADVTRLVRYETDLAKVELRADLRRLGVSTALLAIAAFTGFLMLVMLCFALAFGLQALGIWAWASFLIVTAALIVLAGICAGIIMLLVRRMARLRKTRESVQGSLALLHRDEQSGPPATVPR